MLSVRGGGWRRNKDAAADAEDENETADTNDGADDDGDDFYPLVDDAVSAADDATDVEAAAEATDTDSVEIDMSSPSPTTRTVEMQATSRNQFSRSDGKKSFGLSSLFPSSPILPTERPTFLALSTMMFLFIYVFTTVRDTKDTLVVSHCGAESIPYLKLYGVLPCAMAFIVGYSKLSNLLGKEALFYATLVPFFVFYSLFAYVLYPHRDAIHFPMKAVEAVADAAPGPLSLIRYWSFSLYFIVSELWASAGVPLLFWQVSYVFNLICEQGVF